MRRRVLALALLGLFAGLALTERAEACDRNRRGTYVYNGSTGYWGGNYGSGYGYGSGYAGYGNGYAGYGNGYAGYGNGYWAGNTYPAGYGYGNGSWAGNTYPAGYGYGTWGNGWNGATQTYANQTYSPSTMYQSGYYTPQTGYYPSSGTYQSGYYAPQGGSYAYPTSQPAWGTTQGQPWYTPPTRGH